MPYNITAPRNSFIQFGESSNVISCNFSDINLCLPVYEEDDVWFQFIVTADTEAEADDLCDLTNELVTVSIVDGSGGSTYKVFTEKPDRYRISAFQILYNWQHGLPGFEDVVTVGDCFNIKVVIDSINEATSNCLQRISGTCHTSVIEYGNEENAFGFNYCNSEGEDANANDPCEPTFVSFTNQATMVIPYTAGMMAKYGNAPTIKSWLYDITGELVNMSIRQAFDTYPPTELRFDFGGVASGIIKIS